MPQHETEVSPPRLADLDTQRHVTSRTYEAFAWEGRHRLLADQAYPWERLVDEKILLRPVRSSVRFLKEQLPGARLLVRTELIPNGPEQAWVQEVVEVESAKPACRMVTHTVSEQEGRALDLGLQATSSGEDAWEPEPLTGSPTEFSGACQRVQEPAIMLYSERTPFYDYAPGALWRIAEDGRWHFGIAVGLDEAKIRETDTVTFFTSAAFEYHRLPRPGEHLMVHVWMESIQKIRCFMRQDVTTADGSELLMSVRDEQLIVSLSRRRPRKAPPEFLAMIDAHLEQR